MPGINKKRERESKAPTSKSKKRQKIEAPVQTTKKGKSSNALSKGIVTVDDLDWKAVALPDRLEDAEGFFGLEEIEGVDVLKPEGKGDVRFKVR
jgi:ATP-dependent RNA helicase DDX24/MAK5